MELSILTNKQEYMAEMMDDVCNEMVDYLKICYDEYTSRIKLGRSSQLFFSEPNEISYCMARDIVADRIMEARDAYFRCGKLPTRMSVLIEDLSGINNDIFNLDILVNPLKMVLMETKQ